MRNVLSIVPVVLVLAVTLAACSSTARQQDLPRVTLDRVPVAQALLDDAELAKQLAELPTAGAGVAVLSLEVALPEAYELLRVRLEVLNGAFVRRRSVVSRVFSVVAKAVAFGVVEHRLTSALGGASDVLDPAVEILVPHLLVQPRYRVAKTRRLRRKNFHKSERNYRTFLLVLASPATSIRVTVRTSSPEGSRAWDYVIQVPPPQANGH